MKKIKIVSMYLAMVLIFFQCQETELGESPQESSPDLQGISQLSSQSQFQTGNIYHISTAGNDASGDGSAGNPWRTLKVAVTKVPSNQGHTIKLSAGTFIESGLIEVPLGVNIEGSGKDQTIIKAASTFYYYSSNPGYATDKFLISLSGYNPANGNQILKNFTVEGDAKKLHGGIFVHYRNNVIIEGVKVQNTNFTGIWLWDVKDAQLSNTDLINCSWGSAGWCAGALNLGNLERVDIVNLNVDESTGYGIKAIGPSGYNNIFQLKIHDSRVSVHPHGLWNGGSAPNIAIELWQVNLVGCEIYNTFVDNTISLVNSNAIPSTGVQTIRVHHNILDMESRANGAGYGVELTIHDAEIDHNYFFKGAYGIANWDNPMKNWNIHHNVFYALQGTYPGEIVRSQWSGLHNVKLHNNAIEFSGTKTMNVVGVYGGTSENIELKNNLVINSNTGYSYYPNQLIHRENGAVVNNLNVTNNLFNNLDLNVGGLLGGLLGVLDPILNNLTVDPKITKTGDRPQPYYIPSSGSPLIDAGVNVGQAFLGSTPDIGAFETGGPAGSAPLVNLTSPANNSSFTTGSIVTFIADASDNDGTITKVEFFSGNAKVGEDLTSPYSFDWNNAPAGSHSLTAKASDNSGTQTISSSVTISINNDNNAPSVTITSPVNNSSFTAGNSITIAVSASDSDGSISKVEFYNGSTKLGEDLSSPYSFVWSSIVEGTYNLTAKATDNGSKTTTSSAVSITVNAVNGAPTVSIASPVNNSGFTAGSDIVITANAADSDGTIGKVEFFNGSTKLGEDLSSPYSFVWSNVVEGTYSLTAKATDNGSKTTTSSAVSITVNAVNGSPTVSITSPVNNSSFKSGSDVTISANASDSDGSITKVEFFNGSLKLGEDLSAPYSFRWNNVLPGNYSLTAKATDNTGSSKVSASVNINVVRNVPPTVNITSPASNSNFAVGSSITINASAEDGDGAIKKVIFYRGSTKLGEDTSSPYSLVWGNVPAGSFSLTAKAVDNNNASTNSTPVSVTISSAASTPSNTAPSISLTSPGNNSSFAPGALITIAANAADNDGTITKVEFYSDVTKIGEDFSSPYSFVLAAPASGSYALSAKAIDDKGAVTTSSSVTFSVTTQASFVQVDLDASQASLSGMMTLGTDANAGSYFSVPAGNGKNYYIPPSSSASFSFQVSKTDSYVMWVRVKTPSVNNQSLYVYDGNGRWTTWVAGVHPEWTWVKVTDAYTSAVVNFSFNQGTNNIQFGWLDDNAQVDKLLITNNLDFVPN